MTGNEGQITSCGSAQDGKASGVGAEQFRSPLPNPDKGIFDILNDLRKFGFGRQPIVDRNQNTSRI